MSTLIQRGAGVTLWRQIAETLATEITSGRLKPGQRLDNELALAERFAVNRHTLRRAMAALAEQGILRVEQGRGTFVGETTIDYVLGRRTRFSENLHAQGLAASHCLLSASAGMASGGVAADLGVAEDAPVMRLETLGVADGVALSYAIHTFPLPRFAGIDALAARGSITEALRALGVADYSRKITRLVARLPTVREAGQLEQSQHRPVLQAEAVNVDPDDVPTHHSLTVFAGDRVQMVVPG